MQDLKFWPTTAYNDQPPTNNVFNKFTTKLAYETIASPTENTSSIDRSMPLEKSYQHSIQNREPNHDESFHSEIATNEHTLLGTSKTCTNGWLSSLQNFSVDLGNSLAGNASGATAFMSSEHQPLSGVDSEFAEDSIQNSKYTYWSIQWPTKILSTSHLIVLSLISLVLDIVLNVVYAYKRISFPAFIPLARTIIYYYYYYSYYSNKQIYVSTQRSTCIILHEYFIRIP